nr:class I SAM-dependent methyltransferase [uncultured Sphingorhabdus sp.]
MTKPTPFTPALGKAELTADYDRVIAIMTREKKWRALLLQSVSPQPQDVIVDLGCGTGTFAIMIAKAAPGARVIAVDPDPEVLRIAASKAATAQATVEFIEALGGDHVEYLPYGQVDKVVTSLVLHQCPMDAKEELLVNAHALLTPGGTVFVADYGVQPSLLMQLLFNQVRSLDGYENTRANKDGMIPLLIEQAGFAEVAENWQVQTPTGALTLWTGTKHSA